MVERGKEFKLATLDKTHTETYKLIDISKDGVVLGKNGKNFTVKQAAAVQNAAPTSTP
jgi:type II secretory pathway component PulC